MATTATMSQPGILAPVPRFGAVLVFDLEPAADPRAALAAVAAEPADANVIVGVGEPLVLAMKRTVPGLRGFPALSGVGVAFPSTQGALWLSLRGEDRGEVLDRAMAIRARLGASCRLSEEVDTFRYKDGRDLTGYEDGTENPVGDAATAAAVVASGGAGVAGGSFVAGQRWVHDLARFRELDAGGRDAVFGRRFADNEEMADAPESAHVKRTAQESFEPPAFMVRRSMPWGTPREHGLYFVSYVESLDRFERVLRRMAGLEDGVVDALLGFTRPVSGGYYFCPPMKGGRLDLSALGA